MDPATHSNYLVQLPEAKDELLTSARKDLAGHMVEIASFKEQLVLATGGVAELTAFQELGDVAFTQGTLFCEEKRPAKFTDATKAMGTTYGK